jgi:PIN domain nuclease of toxin-antitoxin system
MILLDTHAWIWWVHRDPLLPEEVQAVLARQDDTLAVSAISLWEVAKLVERGRLELPSELPVWFDMALGGSDMSVVALTPAIAAASASLPGSFHRDPADQIIVATARVLDIPLVTCDLRIRAYPHVRLITGSQVQDR